VVWFIRTPAIMFDLKLSSVVAGEKRPQFRRFCS
jgi:hypothetical protein